MYLCALALSTGTMSDSSTGFCFDIHSVSWIGRRANQEDFHVVKFYEKSSEMLAVVSDGMGGHNCGEVASALAVNSFVSSFEALECGSDPQERLRLSLHRSNEALARYVKGHPESQGMGCTLLACLFTRNELSWVSVGDTGLWLVGVRGISRLNQDHSMRVVVDEAVRQGRLSPEEASLFPNRNALRSAISGESIDLIDLASRPIETGGHDVLVLASDGLETLTLDELNVTVRGYGSVSSESLAGKILEAVREKDAPRQDNLTAIVIRGLKILEQNPAAFSIWESVKVFLKIPVKTRADKKLIWMHGLNILNISRD